MSLKNYCILVKAIPSQIECASGKHVKFLAGGMCHRNCVCWVWDICIQCNMTNAKHPSSSRKTSFLFCRKILNWEYSLCFGFRITFKWNLLYMYLFLTNVFWPVDFLWSINNKPLLIFPYAPYIIYALTWSFTCTWIFTTASLFRGLALEQNSGHISVWA